MARKVIAYFMHEEERDAAIGQMITADVVTDSSVYGEADDGAITRMKAKGLIVATLEEDRPEPRADIFSFEGGGAAGLRAAAGDPSPGWHLVRLSAPLMEPWKAALGTTGVTLRDRTPNGEYRVWLTPQQATNLRGMAFVRSVERDTKEGTAPRAPRIAGGEAAPIRRMLTYDVLLRSEADADAVQAWLRDHHVPVGGMAKNKIRIYLLEDEPLKDEIDSVVGVDKVEQYIAPKLANDRARLLLGIERAASAPALALAQEGEGEIVAIADTGIDDQHPDLKQRIAGKVALGRPGDTSDPDGHGTHVAGSVAGDGSASGGMIRGAAPKAQLYFQSIMDAEGDLGGLPLDLADLLRPAYDAGARVHNNSWGVTTRSTYRANSLEVDRFVRDNKDMVVVIAAGNEGVGTPVVKAQQGFIEWTSISAPATCKNAISVGASRSDRSQHGYSSHTYGDLWPDKYPFDPTRSARVSGDPECLAAFSSRGPCDDMRIKPDLVAPGTDILSTRSSIAPLRNFWGSFPSQPQYALNGGTSMAAPLVAGCAALVREYYRKPPNRHEPSAALVKATLINSTRWLSGADGIADHKLSPNYHQGFGALDMGNCIPNKAAPDFTLQFFDNWKDQATWFQRTGQRIRFRFTAEKGRELRICMAYTDPPSRALVNNLNMLVQMEGDTKKWVGNADIPNGIGIPDSLNNVEIIRIQPTDDSVWMIQVFAQNLLESDQDFALVVTGKNVTPLEVF
jgi:serine protease AprX